ncbi:MAG: MIP/aquaporin family protein, partial [Candidatus Nitrosotenuis sp.]
MQNPMTKLTDNQKRFFAELVGTFAVVVCATGSVVINAQSGGKTGLWFEAFAPFVAVSLMVFLFGKVSMAHFNPAVTMAFLITKHMPARLLPIYLSAEFIGAILASLFVRFTIGTEANLGANSPNYDYPIPLIIGVEVLVTAILLSMIFVVVRTKGLKGFGSVAIGSMIFFDIFFFSFISGASMNPIRSLAPAVLSGAVADLWLYWT